jgi:hypothetical protein
MGHLLSAGIKMQGAEAPTTTTTTTVASNVTVEVYRYTPSGTLYVNGTFYSNPPFGGPTTYSGLAPGTTRMTANSPDCLYATIDYSLNGSYITSYSGLCFANTGDISTSNGNTYSFSAYEGL